MSESERTNLEKPRGTDHVAWAEYNARQARTLAELSGLPAPEPGVIVIEPYQASPSNALTELQRAINCAVDVLQQGGERENRAATQLLTTMALYEQELGR